MNDICKPTPAEQWYCTRRKMNRKQKRLNPWNNTALCIQSSQLLSTHCSSTPQLPATQLIPTISNTRPAPKSSFITAMFVEENDSIIWSIISGVRGMKLWHFRQTTMTESVHIHTGFCNINCNLAFLLFFIYQKAFLLWHHHHSF